MSNVPEEPRREIGRDTEAQEYDVLLDEYVRLKVKAIADAVNVSDGELAFRKFADEVHRKAHPYAEKRGGTP